METASKDMEAQILAAIRCRVTYLREKADSLTVEGVRRLLEQDLGMDKYGLDVHKSFVKQHLVQCLEGDEQGAEEDDKMEDSPVLGLLKQNDKALVLDETMVDNSKQVLQADIKKALRKRSSHIKANSEKITMGVLRRLLEQDLKLDKYSLDPYKKFICEQVDQILLPPTATTEARRKNVTKKVDTKTAKSSGSKETSDSDGEEEEVAVKKKTVQKRNVSKSDGTGKRKRENEKAASAKKTKQTDSESDSDEGIHPSSSEKTVKKQGTAMPGYGKRVEQLKSVIKSCGMSIPPSVYKKAKQAPEEKREDTLIKELKEILAKEGLSSNPSEKDIKEVKKRKQITKELEGIDTSNIVSSSRRRSSTSFVPPPKPEKAEESESDESEDSEDEDDEEDEEEVEEKEEVEEDGEGEGDKEGDKEGEEGEERDEEEEKEGNEDSRDGSQTEREPNTEDGGEEESK